MKKELLTVALLMGTWVASAQVGIGTLNPNKSAQLDVVASDKGILIPRVSLSSVTDQTTITNGNVESLLVYNTNTAEGITAGYYYWFNGEWRKLLTPIDVSTDVLTVLDYDSTTNTLTYVDENSVIHTFALKNTKNSTIVLNGTVLTVTDTDGDVYNVDLASLDTNTTNTSLVLDAQNQLMLTDSSNNTLTADLSPLVNTTKITAGTNVNITGNGSVATPYNINVATATANTLGVVMPGEGMTVGTDGKLNVTQVVTTLTNSRAVGNPIGAYTNELGAIVIINETVTGLTQNASGIHYQPEAGDVQNAKVVSADPDNLIITGTDYGAFLAKSNVQDSQVKYEVIDGTNTTAHLDNSSTADLQKYKVNVATANNTNLGVVKQAATNPTVFINTAGELSTTAWAGNDLVEVSSDYAILLNDVVVLGKATNDITITLPSAAGIKGRKLTVKKSDAENATYVNVVSAGGNIDGENNLYTSLPYSGWDFMSDGTNWRIVNKF